MHCHLLLPDLFWPEREFRDIYSALDIPALEQLLAKGRRWQAETASVEAWLCDQFTVARRQDLPVAPYSLRADGGEPGGHHWFRADPVHLNPQARVVARCHEVNYIDKIRKVGADAIVSPDFTGGMRIVSSMVRPQVVSFLDEMLRADNALRVEEVHIPEGFGASTVGGLKLNRRAFVLLAVRAQDQWEFNPADNFFIGPGNTLVVMTTPEGRKSLEKNLKAAAA